MVIIIVVTLTVLEVGGYFLLLFLLEQYFSGLYYGWFDTVFSFPISILQLGVSADTDINLIPSVLLPMLIVSLFTACRAK